MKISISLFKNGLIGLMLILYFSVFVLGNMLLPVWYGVHKFIALKEIQNDKLEKHQSQNFIFNKEEFKKGIREEGREFFLNGKFYEVFKAIKLTNGSFSLQLIEDKEESILKSIYNSFFGNEKNGDGKTQKELPGKTAKKVRLDHFFTFFEFIHFELKLLSIPENKYFHGILTNYSFNFIDLIYSPPKGSF